MRVIEKEVLLQAILNTETIYEVMEILNCSRNTVKKYMKLYGIKTPVGFYKREGRKVGRPKGIPMTEEQKKFFSNLFSGKGNPFFGKKHSDETRKKMSENHADFTGNKNPFKKSLDKLGKLDIHKERCKEVWENRDIEYRKEFGRKVSKGCQQ